MKFKHALVSWRENRFDEQSTIYICRCGLETGNRAWMDIHVRESNEEEP